MTSRDRIAAGRPVRRRLDRRDAPGQGKPETASFVASRKREQFAAPHDAAHLPEELIGVPFN